MIFISHSNLDAEFVSELRTQLESFGLKTWVDCRELVGGQKLAQEIEQAIDEASYLIAVISPQTVNSKWVRKEIKYALAKQKQNKAFAIIPLLLPGIKIDALDFWFDDEPLAITVEIKPAGLLAALPQILAALGQQAPDKIQKIIELTNQPLEELVLELEEPEIKSSDDKRILFTAKAKLSYQPADPGKREQESRPFRFTAPIGIIELDDLRWYLEQYQIWPAGEFYRQLAQGQRIGEAMLVGQRALMTDNARFDNDSGDGFFIADWFVPVLYQERADPPLFKQALPQRLQDLQTQQRRLALGDLPAEPPHRFIGRSRQLLSLERLLLHSDYAVITGQGGAGKTTLAVELARWLVQSRRFKRAAFVCLEHLGETRAVLDSIGRQLLPDFSVVDDETLKLVNRELANRDVLLVLDNCESLLPDQDGKPPSAAIDLTEFLAFCQDLQQAGAKLLFTSRSALPPPLALHSALGPLSESEAIALIKQVLEQQFVPLPSDVGDKQQWLKAFAKNLNYHARALVRLAPLAAQQGFKTEAEDLAAIMAELHRLHPDSRELSLYASLELSLRRLSAEHQEWVKALAVFHGGFHFAVLSEVLELDGDKARQLAAALVQVGLAEEQNYGYYSLDPALSPYLQMQLSADEQAGLQQRWCAAMQALVDFLYQQKFKDAQLAAQLTLLELPNCLALLSALSQVGDAEQTAKTAGSIEQLLADLQQPQALAWAVKIRQQAAATLGVWGHRLFENKRLDIERLLQQGDIQSAQLQAEALLNLALQAGASAYQGAAYDMAFAHMLLGRVLNRGGNAEAALKPLQQARLGFQALADDGNQSAARMVSVTLAELGDCLRAVGRLDAAAELYQQAIKISEKLDDKRNVVAIKGQLATVRLLQKDYKAALTAYTETKDLFSLLDEPQSVATSWHQTGMVYRAMQDYEQAEQAYRESLKIRSKLGNKARVAASLIELGNLYADWGKPEQAVVFYRLAADSYTQLGDQGSEGLAHSNLADRLIQLQRYDEARSEIQTAIECKKAYGHSAEPWITWNILRRLELACNNSDAAHAAKQQAIFSYSAYRRDGGENMNTSRQLYEAVLLAVRENSCAALLKDLSVLKDQGDLPGYLKSVIPKLIAICLCDRNPALADDPELDYDDVAELLLLLEALSA